MVISHWFALINIKPLLKLLDGVHNKEVSWQQVEELQISVSGSGTLSLFRISITLTLAPRFAT
jgi:hypothetical protein